jgi:hypothetical protein
MGEVELDEPISGGDGGARGMTMLWLAESQYAVGAENQVAYLYVHNIAGRLCEQT